MIYDHTTGEFILEKKDLADRQYNETQAAIRNAKTLEYAMNCIGDIFERASKEIANAKTTARAERIWAEAGREARAWAASRKH